MTTCSQIDRAKAFAAKHGYYEGKDGDHAIYKDGEKITHGWATFYVKFLYDIERDPCA